MKVGNNTTKTIFDIHITFKLMSNPRGRKGVCSLVRQTWVGKPLSDCYEIKNSFPVILYNTMKRRFKNFYFQKNVLILKILLEHNLLNLLLHLIVNYQQELVGFHDNDQTNSMIQTASFPTP